MLLAQRQSRKFHKWFPAAGKVLERHVNRGGIRASRHSHRRADACFRTSPEPRCSSQPRLRPRASQLRSERTAVPRGRGSTQACAFGEAPARSGLSAARHKGPPTCPFLCGDSGRRRRLELPRGHAPERSIETRCARQLQVLHHAAEHSTHPQRGRRWIAGGRTASAMQVAVRGQARAEHSGSSQWPLRQRVRGASVDVSVIMKRSEDHVERTLSAQLSCELGAHPVVVAVGVVEEEVLTIE